MIATRSSICLTAVVLMLVICWATEAMAQNLPFTGTAATAPNVPVWYIRQSGAGRAGQFQILSSANNNTALLGITAGSGVGVFGRTQSGPSAVWGQHLTNGAGVFGSSNAGIGVQGTSITSSGIYGRSTSGIGVQGTSNTNSGVFGQNLNTTRTGQRAGVVGIANAEDGGRFISTTGNGVFASSSTVAGRFESSSGFCAEFIGARGIFVDVSADDGVTAITDTEGKSAVIGFHGGLTSGFGIQGITNRGTGVWGSNQSSEADQYGVVGEIFSINAGTGSVGVRGINNASGTNGIGVWGTHFGAGIGVWGFTAGAGVGVQGSVGDTTNGLAGLFSGNVEINGRLTKTSGAFKIDHPLDPQNKYLYHSFVESPDMKNMYDGTIVLDGNGEAVVQLPEYFEALNKDFRYQLTCVGGFAPVFISERVKNNQFKISGGEPGLEVSWLVTGIRKDAYAVANPLPVEQDKPAKERGTYQHPEAYGLPRVPLTQ